MCSLNVIGRKRLDNVLAGWKSEEITNRGTITFAFNPASQSLYMKYGMYPREPAYYVETPSKTVTENGQTDSELDYEELTSLRDGSAILRQLDDFVLGFSLDWHHEYFFETKARCYIFKDKGDSIGYAYVHPNGKVDQWLSTQIMTSVSQLNAQRAVGSNLH